MALSHQLSQCKTLKEYRGWGWHVGLASFEGSTKGSPVSLLQYIEHTVLPIHLNIERTVRPYTTDRSGDLFLYIERTVWLLHNGRSGDLLLCIERTVWPIHNGQKWRFVPVYRTHHTAIHNGQKRTHRTAIHSGQKCSCISNAPYGYTQRT